MNSKQILGVVVQVLRQVQTAGGHPYAELGAGDCPIDGLEGFDSVLGVEATVMLEKKLGCKIARETVFVSADGERAATVAEICAEVGKAADDRNAA